MNQRPIADHKASIIVPALLNPEAARQCMDLLLEQKYVPLELIVLTGRKYKCRHMDDPRVKIFEVKSKPSPARTELFNRALQSLEGDITVWVAPHFVPEDENWLSELIRPFDDDSTGAVSGCCCKKRGNSKLLQHLFQGSVEKATTHKRKGPGEIDALSLQTDAFRTRLLKDTLSEENASLPEFAEPVELSLRIRQKGYKIMYQPAARMSAVPAHKEGTISLKHTLLNGIRYGQADAFLNSRWGVDWLHGRIFMVGLFSLLLPVLALFSLPFALIGAGLFFLWGWFSGFHVPFIPWEWPVALVNMAVFIAAIAAIRTDWAPSIFPPPEMHPALIRQWMFVLSIPLSYLLMFSAAGSKTALKGLERPGNLILFPPLALLSTAWHLSTAIGYTRETFFKSRKDTQNNAR